MIDWGKYNVNGKIKRDLIATDIKNRVLTLQDIDEILQNPQVRASFIGSQYEDKKEESDWNAEYLDTLVYAVVAEAFNEDYLKYLDQVAGFVSKKKKKKIALAFFAMLALGVLVAVALNR